MKRLRIILAICLAILPALMSLPAAGAPPRKTVGTWYVSRTGSAAGDGTSWRTAWSELDRIAWDRLRPGDVIMIDGGRTSMTYRTAMTVTKSGTSDKPITIRLSDTAGRNGQAVFWGGRDQPIPECGMPDTANMTGVPTNGVLIRGFSNIVLDGTRRNGIVITGYGKNGVVVRDSDGVTLRNLEITNNGTPFGSQGVQLINATHTTVDESTIHDNGVDAIQAAYVDNLAVRNSWMYNSRWRSGACEHSDGLQIYGDGLGRNGDVHHITLENSIFGPNLLQGALLGENNDPNNAQDSWAAVRDVVIRNSLFYDYDAAAIHSHHHPDLTGPRPKNWLIENVTMFHDPARPFRGYHNIYLEGDGHTVRNTVIYGMSTTFYEATVSTANNCQYLTTGAVIGLQADPRFVDAFNPDALAKNFSMAAGSPCGRWGSSITSPQDLVRGVPAYAGPGAIATTPTPSPTPTPTPTPTPAPSPSPTTSQPPVSTALIGNVTASSGQVYPVTTLALNGAVYADRTFVWTELPAAYQGAPAIRTFNADKTTSGSAAVSFELSSPATVYVAFDPRITPIPAWLTDGWRATGETLRTSDGARAVYARSFAAGKVSLGGNVAPPARAATAQSMYSVFALPG